MFYFIKAGNRQSASSWLGGWTESSLRNTGQLMWPWSWKSFHQRNPKAGEMSGMGEGGGGSSGYSRCYLKKDAMWRRAKCLWVAVTWLVPFLPGSNSGACSGGFSSSVSASSYEQRLSLSLINRPSFKWANRMLRSESSISPSLQVLNVKMLTYFFVSSLASSLRPWWGLNPGLVHGRQESYH